MPVAGRDATEQFLFERRGSGGIETADDAWARIRAGATLVQVYSALIYDGPSLPSRIAAGLADRVTRAGLSNISEAVGRGI